MCGSRKYPYPSKGGLLEIPRGKGTKTGISRGMNGRGKLHECYGYFV